MCRWPLPRALFLLLCLLLLVLSACAGRANDPFFPIIIGVATQEPIVLDTPSPPATITLTSAVTNTVVTTPPTTLTPSATITRPLPTATPNIVGSPIAPPSTRLVTPVGIATGPGTPVAVATLPPVPSPTQTPRPTVVATPTPTTYLNYLALIVSGLLSGSTPTPTLPPVPLVITPSPTATPIPTITLTPSATPVDSVVLLARDPTSSSDYVAVAAYADPTSDLDRSWSAFYDLHPGTSDYARIYWSEGARIYDPVVALTATDQWVEGVCTAPTSMAGVQFWGDENDGWARVLIDGVERWRGNTYGQSPDLFIRFLAIRNLSAGPHVIRVEPLGERGSSNPGSNIHVSVYAIVCGLALRSEIYVPLLLR